LLYGALLIVAPMIGALVLTWWLGAYALLFGVALLVLAFSVSAPGSARPCPLLAVPVSWVVSRIA
jgi:hypothetical protein